MPNRAISIVGFLTFFVQVQNQNIGIECPSPVQCLSENEFTFCSIINGEVVLEPSTVACPDGFVCVEDPFVPCVKAQTTTAAPVTAPLPSQCENGATFPAPHCNQYYQCVKKFWWNEVQLKTCSLNFAFDRIKKSCVPIVETNCKL